MNAEKVRALSPFDGNFYDGRFRVAHDRSYFHAQIGEGSNEIPQEFSSLLGEASRGFGRAEVDGGVRSDQSVNAFRIARSQSLAQFERE